MVFSEKRQQSENVFESDTSAVVSNADVNEESL